MQDSASTGCAHKPTLCSKQHVLPSSEPSDEACGLLTDELERGERSTLSLESMASSRTGRTPSVPGLLAVQEWGYQALGQGIWPAVLALFLSVSTSILVFPFFPYVPSSGSFGDALPQVSLHHTNSDLYRCGCCCQPVLH